MYRKLIGTLIFSLSLLFSQALFADGCMCKQGLKTMLKSLNLSAEQKARIEPVIQQMKTTMKDTGSQMGALESRIGDQMASATMSQETVNSLVDKKTVLIGTIMKARINAVNKILGVLTPEQKTSLLAMMKKAEDKIQSRFKSCHKGGE